MRNQDNFLHAEVQESQELAQFLSFTLLEKLSATQNHILELLEEILNRLPAEMAREPVVQPRMSAILRSADDQQVFEEFLKRVQTLPGAAHDPQINAVLGRLGMAVGQFDKAQTLFATSAAYASQHSAQAQAHYNAYQAALEQRHWDDAKEALLAAAQLDPLRFEPFPLRKYALKQILGAGGFGSAFLCEDQHLEIPVVIKTLHQAALERNVREVFREARTLQALQHPNIIQMMHCDFADREETRPYLVMAYFSGTALDEYLKQHGHLPAASARQLAVLLAEAMHAAHQQGILHRDLKPANILVNVEDGIWNVRIIDFGLALQTDQLQKTALASQFTGSLLAESVGGTYQYAAPEQMGLRPGKIGPHSDVFGFGKTLCQAIFATTNPTRRDWRNLETEDELLADLLSRCIDEDITHRIPNFIELLSILSDIPASADTAISHSSELLQTSTYSSHAEESLVDNNNEQLLQAAEQGNIDAQFNLGWMYQNGHDLPKDDVKSVHWYRLAATQGHADAQCNLGWMYATDCGVKQDQSEAVNWYQKAAVQGQTQAQYNLGVSYANGNGVKQDDAKAEYWWRLAAEQGHDDAQQTVCFIDQKKEKQNHTTSSENALESKERYSLEATQENRDEIISSEPSSLTENTDIKNNHASIDVKSHSTSWWKKFLFSEENLTYKNLLKAAQNGDVPSQFKLGKIYEKGQGVKKDDTEAARWYKKAAEQGNMEAQYSLGLMYTYGEGVKEDDAEAAKWYKKAADQGHNEAQFNLAVMYNNGEGVKQDYAEAIKWYKKAAEQGNASAQNNLGIFCENGIGAEKNYAEAVWWYKKAAEQGNAGAQFNLGKMYHKGQGVKQDDTKAVLWYRKGAEQGNPWAQNNLAWMYAKGLGVKQDEAEAVRWYRKAAEQGDEDALKALARRGVTL